MSKNQSFEKKIHFLINIDLNYRKTAKLLIIKHFELEVERAIIWVTEYSFRSFYFYRLSWQKWAKEE